MGDWQPIATAPKDGTKILAWCSEWERVLIIEWTSGVWAIELSDQDAQPTDWQPLPQRPGAA